MSNAKICCMLRENGMRCRNKIPFTEEICSRCLDRIDRLLKNPNFRTVLTERLNGTKNGHALASSARK